MILDAYDLVEWKYIPEIAIDKVSFFIIYSICGTVFGCGNLKTNEWLGVLDTSHGSQTLHV